jgi:hypothetical protein
MYSPNDHRSFYKLTIIHIFIRSRVWRLVNAYFLDPRTQLLIIIQFSSIRVFRVEFLFYFPSNTREYLAFREDFFDSLIVSRSSEYLSFLLAVIVVSHNVKLH